MNIVILFGTESGNAEMVAAEIQDALEAEHDVELSDLADFAPDAFNPEALHLVVCSTHGEGELPQSAQPFATRMREESPNLDGVRYAVFGMGDSTYAHYSRGSEHLDLLLREAGAARIGEYGRHDAAGRQDPIDGAVAWATETVSLVDLHV